GREVNWTWGKGDKETVLLPLSPLPRVPCPRSQMADAVAKSLQITIVTPEKAVLDEAADFVVLPLHDGEIGVLPGRAAFVGQMGPGELRITQAGAVKRYFVDGGFVQVRSNRINVLTAAAKKPEEITDSVLTAERT